MVEYGYKAGRKPATCRACGKTFPRPNVTLADFFPVKSGKKKGNNSRNVSPATSRRSRSTSPAMSRWSSVVSWSDSPRDQAVPKSEDAVMEDCTESHQAVRSTGRSEQTTNCIKFSRTCQMNTNRSSTVTVSRQECSRWRMRKWPCWQPRGNSYLCKVGWRNKRITWNVFRDETTTSFGNSTKMDRG